MHLADPRGMGPSEKPAPAGGVGIVAAGAPGRPRVGGSTAGIIDPGIGQGLAAGGPDDLSLPRAARPGERPAWDERLRHGDLEDLQATADAFADLAGADARDSSAWYNRGLCLAWMGRNGEAIACLDRTVAD